MSMAAVAGLPTWKNKLLRNKSGVFYNNELNVHVALEQAPELKDILEYNEFSDAILLKRLLPSMPADADDKLFLDVPQGPWSDEHVTWLTLWLLAQGFTYLRRSVVQDVVVAVAKAASFHPVREYLEGCRGAWDGKPRLDAWLTNYLAASNPGPYLAAVGSKFLIGAVARIVKPACQMDSMLVLEGGQGTGKSTAVRILGREWSRDVTGDLGGKDAAIHIQGVWIGEMSELSSIRRSDQEAIKGFVSRRIDHYRPPYGRNAVDRPRHTVFVATTNESEYLQDPTGARRFWPVECGVIDLAGLERDMDQLWGEAAQRYKDGEAWHLAGIEVKAAAVEQSYRQKLTPVDTLVLEYADSERAAGNTEIEMRVLLREAFDIETRKDPAKAGGVGAQAARALLSHGWMRLNPVGRGPRRRQMYRYVGSPEDSPCEQPCEQPCEGSLVETHKDHNDSQGKSAYDDDIPF